MKEFININGVISAFLSASEDRPARVGVILDEASHKALAAEIGGTPVKNPVKMGEPIWLNIWTKEEAEVISSGKNGVKLEIPVYVALKKGYVNTGVYTGTPEDRLDAALEAFLA